MVLKQVSPQVDIFQSYINVFPCLFCFIYSHTACVINTLKGQSVINIILESHFYNTSSSEATGSWSPPPLIVIRNSFSLWTWARIQTARSDSLLKWMSLYIFDILKYICVPHFYDLSALVGCWSSVSIRIIYKFLNGCPFDYTAVAVSR